MEILGVGMSELVFIVIIALIVLGPKDMQKAGKTIGKWMRSIVTSDGWKIFQQTSRELRTLPTKLMRDANEELNQNRRPARERYQGRLNSYRQQTSNPKHAATLPAFSCHLHTGKTSGKRNHDPNT